MNKIELLIGFKRGKSRLWHFSLFCPQGKQSSLLFEGPIRGTSFSLSKITVFDIKYAGDTL